MSDKTLTTVFTKLRRKFLGMAMAILPNEIGRASCRERVSLCV